MSSPVHARLAPARLVRGGRVSQAQVQSDGGAEAKGWAALGSMIAGPAFYGGVGWLLDRLTGHDGLFVVIGLVLGGVLAMVSVFYRFWR